MCLMLNAGLNFAPGTTEESQRLVAKLAPPEEILSAYRQARASFGTGDIVLSISEQDPSGFEAEPRVAYIRRLRQHGRIPLLMHGLVSSSAHSVAKLPFESEAVWLIVVRGPKAVPITCVIFATPYETGLSVTDNVSALN